MKKKKIATYLTGLVVALCASAAHAGLLGSTATITGHFPNLSTNFFGPSVTTVTAAIEVPASSISSHSGFLDITDTQIVWHADISAGYGSAPFNGFRILFSGAPPITSVTLNGASTLIGRFEFTANEVLLNLTGLSAVVGERDFMLLDINPASPVPLPPAAWLLGSAFGALVVRRRSVEYRQHKPA